MLIFRCWNFPASQDAAQLQLTCFAATSGGVARVAPAQSDAGSGALQTSGKATVMDDEAVGLGALARQVWGIGKCTVFLGIYPLVI